MLPPRAPLGSAWGRPCSQSPLPGVGVAAKRGCRVGCRGGAEAQRRRAGGGGGPEGPSEQREAPEVTRGGGHCGARWAWLTGRCSFINPRLARHFGHCRPFMHLYLPWAKEEF